MHLNRYDKVIYDLEDGAYGTGEARARLDTLYDSDPMPSATANYEAAIKDLAWLIRHIYSLTAADTTKEGVCGNCDALPHPAHGGPCPEEYRG